MPGFYADGEYDVAGFIVGAVERAKLVDGRGLAPGDVLLGAAFGGPAHQRLLAGPPHRLRPARARGRQPRAASSARRSARRCCVRTGPTCGRFSRCWRPGWSRAWRTSPAAASPTTCRASCRRARRPKCDSGRGRCCRCSQWLARRRGRCARRPVPRLQHGRRPGRGRRRAPTRRAADVAACATPANCRTTSAGSSAGTPGVVYV